MEEKFENGKKQHVLRSVKGFNVVKREYDKKTYLKYICEKEDKIIAELLASRNIKLNEKNNFLEPKLKNLLPTADTMKDISSATERIIKAINDKEKICIFGDYDVDGSTSVAMWILFLEKLGIQANYYIPDRISEGYGPNCSAIEKIAKNNVKLLISVDCGTNAFEPFEKAILLGMDVIIIDHHQSSEVLPQCIACVNPNRFDETNIKDEMKHLCACGVSFFVIMSINSKLRESNRNVDLMQFTPLVAFATICDVMKLTTLNRAFIKTGINVLQNNKELFNLYELVNINNNFQKSNAVTQKVQLQKNITAYSFGFLLGPLINAGGRIGNSSLGVELMIEKNKQTAKIIAEKLFTLNEERKNIETETLHELSTKKNDIMKQIKEYGYIMLYSEKWHEGVIGLIASRLKDKYFYPVFAGTKTSDGNIKFSARSVDNVDIGEIIIQAREQELIITGGGHKLAGGLSCNKEKIIELKQFLKEKIKINADNYFTDKTIKYDVVLSLSGLTDEILEKISKFGPFGSGNPKPMFLIQDVLVEHVDIIKDKHILLSISDNEKVERAICFNVAGTEFGNFLLSSKNSLITVIATAELDEWNGQRRKSIKIEDAILKKI